jgi:hypothetical protein
MPAAFEANELDSLQQQPPKPSRCDSLLGIVFEYFLTRDTVVLRSAEYFLEDRIPKNAFV